MKCPHCGREVADNSKFCEFCGKEVRQMKPIEPKNPNATREENKISSEWIYAFVVILLIVVCIVAVEYNSASKDTESSGHIPWTIEQPSEQITESEANPEYEETEQTIDYSQDAQTDYVSQTQSDYVDLGLPSGTRWKTTNERGGNYNDGLYPYDDALELFRNSLPTHAQMEELFTKCQWEWNGSGYDVIGPNGQMISLPLTGYRESDGTLKNRYITGNYWTKDIRQAAKYKAWKLYFRSDHKEICSWPRLGYHAVRLVE